MEWTVKYPLSTTLPPSAVVMCAVLWSADQPPFQIALVIDLFLVGLPREARQIQSRVDQVTFFVSTGLGAAIACKIITNQDAGVLCLFFF